MIKLGNHRRLKRHEFIRKGDFYVERDGLVRPVKYSIGEKVSTYRERILFWRRKHTAKMTVIVFPKSAVTPKPVAKCVTVTFKYKNRHREVQVIELNGKYLTGLEVTRFLDDTTSPKYQFKKFLRSKLQSSVTLVRLVDK